MNPEIVLETTEDRQALVAALQGFAKRYLHANTRQAVLKAASIDFGGLRYDAPPQDFAFELFYLLTNPVLSENASLSHPLWKFLTYFTKIIDEETGFNRQDRELFGRLLSTIDFRVEALRVRQAVGKIEDQLGKGLGSGILLPGRCFLTCRHVFTKSHAIGARVRFGLKKNSRGAIELGQAFDLLISEPVSQGGGPLPDFILLRIANTQTDLFSVPSQKVECNAGDCIRMVHYPEAGPIVISDPGKILHVDTQSIQHNINAVEGSSGAPIFNKAWQLVAIHRGYIKKKMEAVAFHAIWDSIDQSIS